MTSYKWFTKEEVASWPEGHKKCRRCLEVLPLSSFHKQKATILNVANYCKACKQEDSKKAWASTSFEYSMWSNARSRARKEGYPFDLELTDINIPEKCPILGVDIELTRGSQYAPSIDKVDPRLGYVKGNIVIMSYRANMLKSNMTYLEAQKLSDWMQENAKHVDGWTYTWKKDGRKDVTVTGRIEWSVEAPTSAFDPSI